MTELRAARPFGLRVLNKTGAALRKLGVPIVRLDPDSLLQTARKSTGLTDFGHDRFRDPLARLVESLETEAQLTILGRMIARRDLLRLLEFRLRHAELRKQHPEIEYERVEKPLFILGMPRTGTSILHELMAQDPQNRVPMSWEVMFPFPPPEAASYDSDPRIAQVDEHLSGVDRLIPDFKKMHPMSAQLPQECAAITQFEFASMIWHTSNRVPRYEKWFESADQRSVYEAHKRFLQMLQWKAPGERWVLKSPQHLWTLEALLAVYPDARIVQNHRDPLKVVASLASLIATLRSLAMEEVDAREIGRDWTQRLASGLEHATRVRDEAKLPESQILDIPFREFMADEISMVRKIYDHFGMEYTAEAERRMRAFLAANAADKHGRHSYDLSAAGLDEATERKRYAAYQERFGIPSERMDKATASVS
jgi:hypothetical protein